MLTMCCSFGNKVEHYRVMRDDRNWVTVDDEEYFENLFKLVEVSGGGYGRGVFWLHFCWYNLPCGDKIKPVF